MSLKSSLSVLSIVVGVALCLAGADSGSAHQSTISTESASQAPQEKQQEAAAKVLAALETGDSSDSIEAMMDDKFLDGAISGNQIDAGQTASLTTQEEISDKHNSPFGGSKSSSQAKSQRQSEQQTKAVDWWTNLVNENKAKKGNGEVKSGDKPATKAPKSVVYREQPLEQNPLLTIRHQLMAIRDKHQMLMFRSVPQLMQLDQKLVDSYRLCLRRKMPLYAGMLYRTRSYVVRLANEIKQERQVLEATAKQIQKVLRHKSTNSSLVGAYNRQLAALTGLAPLGLSQGTASDQEPVVQQRPHYLPASPSDQSVDGSDDSSATFQKASSLQGANRDSQSETSRELPRGDKQGALDQRQNSINYLEQGTSQNEKSHSRSKNVFRRPAGNYRFSNQDGQQHEDDAVKKPKQKFYTVNVNEVNLKKELTKAQTLIDRVNASSHELMAVVDDIVYLFKLTSGSSNSGKGLSTSSRKFKKMMLKSPFQSFFERQGKAMKSITPGDMTSNALIDLNMNNMPEMKPLFDSPSFTVYKDPVDIDLGFDTPAVLDI